MMSLRCKNVKVRFSILGKDIIHIRIDTAFYFQKFISVEGNFFTWKFDDLVQSQSNLKINSSISICRALAKPLSEPILRKPHFSNTF